MSISTEVNTVEKSRFQSKLSKNLDFKISKNLDFNQNYKLFYKISFIVKIVENFHLSQFFEKSRFKKNEKVGNLSKFSKVSILVKIFEKSRLSIYSKNLNSIQTLRKNLDIIQNCREFSILFKAVEKSRSW